MSRHCGCRDTHNPVLRILIVWFCPPIRFLPPCLRLFSTTSTMIKNPPWLRFVSLSRCKDNLVCLPTAFLQLCQQTKQIRTVILTTSTTKIHHEAILSPHPNRHTSYTTKFYKSFYDIVLGLRECYKYNATIINDITTTTDIATNSNRRTQKDKEERQETNGVRLN